MHYDFSRVDETESYITVPPGLYSCKITEVRPGFARDGSERWTFRLEVLDGEYAGRMAAWDSLTWSDRGVLRVKMVLGAFGFDVSGELDIAPGDLYDVRVKVQESNCDWRIIDDSQQSLTIRSEYEEGDEYRTPPTSGPDWIDELFGASTGNAQGNP